MIMTITNLNQTAGPDSPRKEAIVFQYSMLIEILGPPKPRSDEKLALHIINDTRYLP